MYPLLSYQLSQLLASCYAKFYRFETKDPELPNINIEWLGREIAILGWLLEVGADPTAQSKELPESFIEQLTDIGNHEPNSTSLKIPEVLVKSVLCEAFTVERLYESSLDVEKTVRFNLEDTEEWLNDDLLDPQKWWLWPESWREWKIRWIKRITEAEGEGVNA